MAEKTTTLLIKLNHWEAARLDQLSNQLSTSKAAVLKQSLYSRTPVNRKYLYQSIQRMDKYLSKNDYDGLREEMKNLCMYLNE